MKADGLIVEKKFQPYNDTIICVGNLYMINILLL